MDGGLLGEAGRLPHSLRWNAVNTLSICLVKGNCCLVIAASKRHSCEIMGLKPMCASFIRRQPSPDIIVVNILISPAHMSFFFLSLKSKEHPGMGISRAIREEYLVLGPAQYFLDLVVISNLVPNRTIARRLMFHPRYQIRTRQSLVGRSDPEERE
jgi:hypothetical protein